MFLQARFRMFVLAACSIFGVFTALDTVSAFALSPALVDLSLSPGSSQGGVIRVTNTEDRQMTFYISVQKFVSRGEEGQQDFLPPSANNDVASWIIPEVQTVTLGPRESSNVEYSVSVPGGAAPGGHYAAMFFSTAPPSGTSSSGVGVGAKTGALFLLRISGAIREDARVESFRLEEEGVLSRLPANFELRIRNLGNVHLRPQGAIELKNMLGMRVADVPLNYGAMTAVLPSSIRRLETSWARDSHTEEGGFLTELQNEWSNFALGRYTAELHATYGASQEPLTAEISFWVFPWRLMVMSLVALVVLVTLLSGYNRFVIHRAVAKAARRA